MTRRKGEITVPTSSETGRTTMCYRKSRITEQAELIAPYGAWTDATALSLPSVTIARMQETPAVYQRRADRVG
jgi:hypothetical protein